MRVARAWCSKYGSPVKETRAPWRTADFQLGLGKIQALLSETKEVLREYEGCAEMTQSRLKEPPRVRAGTL